MNAPAPARRACAECGGDFAPARRGGQEQRFCSSRCRRRAHAKRKAANGRAAGRDALAEHAEARPTAAGELRAREPEAAPPRVDHRGDRGPARASADQAARPERCALPDALPDAPDRPFGVRLEDALPSDALAPPALPWDERARA